MAQPSPSARLAAFVDGVSIKPPLFTGSVTSSEIKDFALRAFLEPVPSFPLLGGLSRHLFLSVLRI